MKNPRQLIIASDGLVQDILRSHTQRQQTRIDNFKLIIPQIKIDVAPLGVGTMHQRIDQQLLVTLLLDRCFTDTSLSALLRQNSSWQG